MTGRPGLRCEQDYRAILFDFDGVLADTMEDNYAAWVQAFGAHGIALPRKEFFVLEGMNVETLAKTVLARRNADQLLAAAIGALKEKTYKGCHRFRLYPGAAELIAELRQTYALGLVSGAGLSRIRQTTPAELLTAFRVLITGDDVRQPKPHPEPYLKAAEKLGIEPRHCLVVENAPLGITAAKNAGMDCVALCTTLGSHFLRQADVIIEHIDQLRSVLPDRTQKQMREV
jgi:beta-phosphoglucomutase